MRNASFEKLFFRKEKGVLVILQSMPTLSCFALMQALNLIRKKRMRSIKILVATASFFLLMFSQPVFAQGGIPGHSIDLPGSSAVQLKGKLEGPDNSTRDYVVHVKKGQTLSVALDADKLSSTYFNIVRQESDEALFVGETQHGKAWQQQIQDGGKYIVRIYLDRAVARRGESSRYTLSISAS